MAPSVVIHEQDYVRLKACKHGTFLYNINDSFIGKSLDLYGEWCESELDILQGLLQPGHVVLDIGSNIGTHAVCFAKCVGPHGLVYAFEPQRLVFQNLCANIALNALTNVIARQIGVSDTSAQVLIRTHDPRQPLNFGAIGIHGHQEGEPVDLVRIDDLALTRCDVVKVDVEGMEAKVLRGARETIARFQPVLFVENNTLEHSREVIDAVLSLGYVAYWKVANYFNPRNHFGNPANVFARFHPEANMLCFPNSSRWIITGGERVIDQDDDWRKAVARMTS